MHCVGARVNGRMVPLDYRLQNGEFVEILTSKNARPSQDWLNIVKTSKARSKIRGYFKEMHREESLARGKEALEREAKRLGLDPADVFRSERMHEVAKRYGLADVDDVYAGVGFGKLTVSQVLSRLLGRQQLEALRRELRERQRKHGAARPARQTVRHGVVVEGVDNVLIRFSRCCNPVPGDEIVGYITRGRGVSVHRRDCPNLLALDGVGRWLEVRWQQDASGTYPVEILVEAVDRVNLLANIMESITDGKTNVGAINARTDRQNNATGNLTVDIPDVEHMQHAINRIMQGEGVLHGYRGRPSWRGAGGRGPARCRLDDGGSGSLRAVIQRVASAGVTVDGQEIASIGRGLLVLLGVGLGDGEDDAALMAEKLAGLRVFDDGAGKMNL